MSALILFSTNNLPGSIAIRWGTWSRFSHCDLVTESGQTVIGATPFGGVHEYPLDERLSGKFALYNVDADLASVEAAAREQIGKPYDWLGCLGIAAHRDWQDEDRWFCSELIAHAFAKAGTPLVNPDLRLNRVTPEALLRSPLLRHIASTAEVLRPEAAR
jgi:uncharacterized protein YycO